MCDASLHNIWDLQISDTGYCLCLTSRNSSALIESFVGLADEQPEI